MQTSTVHAVKGIGAFGFVKIVAKALALMRVILVAKILSPSDLGIFGIVTLVLALTEVFSETGINIFLIRSEKPLAKYIDTAWIISLLRGFGISLCMAILAYPLSVVFHQESLVWLIFFAASIPVIRGCIHPSIVVLQKELHFRTYSQLRLALSVIENLSMILFVYLLHSVFGLLLGMFVMTVIEMIVSHVISKQPPRLRWSASVAREIFQFAKWFNLSGIFGYLSNNIDDLFVGKMLGTSALGIYQMGYNIAQSSTADVGEVVGGAMFPIQTKHKNTSNYVWRSYIINLSVLILFFLLVYIAVTLYGSWGVTALFGEDWRAVAGILPVLTIALALQGINNITFPLFYIEHHPQKYTVISFIQLVMLGICIYPLITSLGILGASWAILLSRIVVQPVYAYWILRSKSHI